VTTLMLSHGAVNAAGKRNSGAPHGMPHYVTSCYVGARQIVTDFNMSR
jgi:hypothetical protein